MRILLILSLIFQLSLTLLLSQCLCSGQSIEDDIDSFIEQIMTTNKIPGLSLAVVKDGNIFITKGYGRRDLTNSSLPVTEDTLFYIASTTKAFTAALLAQLALEHNISLNTPVRHLLPEFYLSEYYRQEYTTLKDLLAHRAGVPDSLYNWLLGAVTTRADIVSRARFFHALNQFRESMTYNNLHYIAAGVVVERLTGSEWEEEVRSRIFEPLSMTSSSFMDRLTSEQRDRLATPYAKNLLTGEMKEVSLEFFKNTGPGGPSGSIVSSAKDLAQWLLLLTDDGLNTAGDQVISASVLKQQMSPHIVGYPSPDTSGPFNMTADTYGLGWFTGYYRGYRMSYHSGYLFSYQARATVYPDQRLAIFTCDNGDAGDGQTHIHNYISDLLLFAGNESLYQDSYSSDKLTDTDFSSESVSSKVEASEEKGIFETKDATSTNSAELLEYVGKYFNYAFGYTDILMNETIQTLYGVYGNLMVAQMRPRIGVPDEFMSTPDDPLWFFPPMRLIFSRNLEGNVINVTIPILLPENPPVFTKNLDMSTAPPPLTEMPCQENDASILTYKSTLTRLFLSLFVITFLLL